MPPTLFALGFFQIGSCEFGEGEGFNLFVLFYFALICLLQILILLSMSPLLLGLQMYTTTPGLLLMASSSP
jgi:hypothetical protein